MRSRPSFGAHSYSAYPAAFSHEHRCRHPSLGWRGCNAFLRYRRRDGRIQHNIDGSDPRGRNMHFNRRIFLQGGVAIPLAAAMPRWASASGAFDVRPGTWRTFEVVTRLEITDPEGKTQAWVPVPAVNEPGWFKSLGSEWTGNGKANLVRDSKYGSVLVHAERSESESKPVIQVTSRISTRDRAIDLSQPGNVNPLSAAEHKIYTEGTELIPVDGIVKETSDRIVAGATTDFQKAHAIYEWIVANTARDAKVRGCGIGDIVLMLKMGALSGKCADINALYVGLVRAAGVPARDVYGIRVAPS